MSNQTDIDVTFDFRSDTPDGRDPDQYSATLRRYHQLLWSKPLPGGAHFDLDISDRKRYLHHKSDLGEFFLSSDTVIPTFIRRLKLAPIIDQIPDDVLEAFLHIRYTIGGMMVFPGNVINRKVTINGARGFNGRIGDRFDLTLECIRCHYLGEASPLGEVLDRYSNFFDLFIDFRGYVNFFLLQDLVTANYSEVQFFLPFADFTTSAHPSTVDEYTSYRLSSIDFIEARNRRIAAF